MKSLKTVREAASQNNKVDTRLLVGMLGECTCSPSAPDEEILYKELAEFLNRAFLSLKLSERDRDICRRVFEGEGMASIARDKKLSRERVRKIVRKTRNLLAMRLRGFK